MRNDFEVLFFGDQKLPMVANFPYKILKVMPSEKLGELYRSCDIGCVFSGTNYSLIPVEMMASGLPLLEFDGDNIRSTFPQETISLAKPIPQDVRSVLDQLLSHPEKRRKQSECALKFVSSFSWQKSARNVESAFLKTVFNKNDN